MVAIPLVGHVTRNGMTRRVRERGVLIGALAVVTASAWLLLALGHEGVPHHDVDLTTFTVAVLLWLAMAVGMMLPPLLPWIVGFAALSRQVGAPSVLHTHLFVAGYLTVWGAFSVAAAAAQLGIALGAAAIDLPGAPGPRLGGMALLVAGAFQLTPFKCGALTHCRSPISYLIARWENGPAGAIRLGWRHGLHCLACCWALMGLALALGAMNLLWMAAPTVAIGLEKLARHGRRWSVALGGALIAAGAWLLAVGRWPPL